MPDISPPPLLIFDFRAMLIFCHADCLPFAAAAFCCRHAYAFFAAIISPCCCRRDMLFRFAAYAMSLSSFSSPDYFAAVAFRLMPDTPLR